MQFESDASSATTLITEELDECLLAITALAAYNRVIPEMDPRHFKAFTASFLTDRPELKAMEWIPKIARSEQASFERRMRAAGFDGFQIHERDANNRPTPAGVRDTYYPVALVEPVRGNEPAIGFDLGSNKVRRQAIERARDTGKPAVTSRIRLVQEKEQEFGFLILFPVYRLDMPIGTIQERRTALQGYALGVFRAGDVLRAAFDRTKPRGLEINLLDLSAPTGEQQLHHWNTRLISAPSWMHHLYPRSPLHRHTFSLSDRQWCIEIQVTPGYMDLHYPLRYWLTIPVGLCITFVLIYILTLLSQRSLADQLVQSRTEKLHEAERDVRDVHAIQDLILNNSSIGIAFVREDHFEWVNPRLAEMFGYSMDQIQGAHCAIIYPSNEAFVLQAQQLNPALIKGERAEASLQLQRNGGRLFWCRSIAKALNASDPSGGTIWMFEDITEQKSAEDALRQAQKMESLGLMAGGIAHEINTPTQFIGDNISFLAGALNEVFAFIQSVKDRLEQSPALPSKVLCCSDLMAAYQRLDLDYLREEIPQAIRQSQEGISRVNTIVRAMKDFSHPSLESLEPTDINRTIENALIVSSSEWKYIASLQTDLDETLPPVMCFRDAVNQTLLNLIVNAAHAIEERVEPGQKGAITVSTRRMNGEIEIRLGDSGTGIPDDIRPRIFDPFFTTKPLGKGTGQGLAFVHAAVEKHKGSIEVQSKVGQGTTFILRLPIKETP